MKNSIKYLIIIPAVLTLAVFSFLGSGTAKAVTTSMPLCEIVRGLAIGSSGEDVRCLQKYLNWSGFTLAASGAGSPVNETFYFGARTQAAVKTWQEFHSPSVLAPLGLTTGTGFWGTYSQNRYVSLVRVALGLRP